MKLPLPKQATKKRKASTPKVATKKDGWIDTTATKKKKLTAATAPRTSSNKKSSAKKTTIAKPKATTKRGKTPTASKLQPKKPVKTKANEVIELIEDSDDESDSGELEIVMNKKARPRRVSTAYASVVATSSTDHQNNFSDDDSDSEYEFK